MNDEKYKRYVISTLVLLKNQAIETKKRSGNFKDISNDITQGIIMGYYSIITLLKNQAFSFCIDQKQLGLSDISPDIDLLGLNRNPNIDFAEDNYSIDPINEKNIKYYICDSITLLKEQALEAKKGLTPYAKGELKAYHKVISTMKKQALICKIDENELGLSDINPERDLL